MKNKVSTIIRIVVSFGLLGLLFWIMRDELKEVARTIVYFRVEYMLLGLGGAITITPLLWFAAAAVRLPLTILGFFQYIAPTLSLLIAVYLYNEPVAPSRWVSFSLIWLALAVFSVEGLVHTRRTARLAG